MRTIAIVVALVMLVVLASMAQEPTLAFEVASVKRNVSGAAGFGGSTSTAGARPTGFIATNVTLPTLIRIAYQFEAGMPNPFQPDDRVLGAPGWMQTQRFDIVASAGREISRDEAHEMLRTLLAERFKLVVVREQRKSDAYALRLARADGRLGPDLHRVADDCSVTRPKDPFDRMKLLPHPSNGAGPSFATACATTESIAAAIAAIVNATVIDETGLSGRWDFVISHAGLQSGIVRGPNGMEERPSIHVAVQEQLGLKLERRQGRGSFEVLVIKSAEQPTEN